MITVREEVQKIIMESPFLEDALKEGIINYSALARKIRRRIEKKLFKEVSEASIMMALRREASRLGQRKDFKRKLISQMKDIIVRSNLCEFTFIRSESILECEKRLLKAIQQSHDSFVTFTHGLYETTLIVNADIVPLVKETFKREKNVSHFKGLSAISIKLPKETAHVPGIYHLILKRLAKRGINVVEVVSTLSEFVVILKQEDVHVSFSVLMDFISAQ